METKSCKSFHYRAKTTWSSARRGLLSAAEKPTIIVGSPPEFKGEPNIWAPKELLIGPINTCMMLTFLSLAQARGLTPTGYESEAEGLLEDVDGKYSFTKVTVRPLITVKGEGELKPTREILESAEARCFISNSVKAKVKVVAELVVAPSPSEGHRAAARPSARSHAIAD